MSTKVAASSSHRSPGPVRRFEGHKDSVTSISIFPDRTRIVTGSFDKTIRIWRLEDGKEVVKWVVGKAVGGIAILQNGVHVVSAEGDVAFASSADWYLWVRNTETRAVVAGPLGGHTNMVADLELSPDGRILASSSSDNTVILWDTSTWKMHGDPLLCGAPANNVQFSPSGCVAVATNKGIQIWDLTRKERHQFSRLIKGHPDASYGSLAWTQDGTRLFSAGDQNDPFIRSWDASTWKEAGDPWTGHGDREDIIRIVLNPANTLLASASADLTVRLWMLSTGTEVARYEYKDMVLRIAFSKDGRSLFSCGMDGGILQWNIPGDVLAAARSDSLAGQLKTQGPSRGKQRNNNGLLDSQIPGQHRNKALNYERLDGSRPQGTPSAPPRTDAGRPSPSRLHGVRSLFNRIQHQWKRMAPVVVDVPLAPATYRDYVASEEDGRRPYALFFCLLWCQAKRERPDPIPQVYDVDLMNAEQERDPLDVPIPTPRVKFAKKEDIELVSVASQPQAVAGPSRIAETEGHQVAQSSTAPSSS